jgi:hypothetical protein
MNSRTFFLLVAMALSGCDYAAMQREDQQAVAQSGVSRAVYEKMVHGAPLTVDDVIALSQAHVHDYVMKRYMDDQGTIYHLTKGDADRLHQGGVSYDLIQYMDGTVTHHWPYPKAGPYLTPFGRGA